MRFTVDAPALNQALTWVSRSIPARPAIPVLSGVRISIEGGWMRLTGFDGERRSTDCVRIDNPDITFDAAVSGKVFRDLVATMKTGDITVEIDDTQMVLRRGRSTFALPLMRVDTYPATPADVEPFGTVAATDLTAALKATSFCVAREESVPMLQAVRITADPATQTLTFYSTDRYRLSRFITSYTPTDPDDTEPHEYLVVPSVFDNVSKGLNGADTVTLCGSDSQFGLTIGSKSTTSSVLNGAYPDVNRLIPADVTDTITLTAADVTDALARIALLSNSARTCRFDIADEAVRITNSASDAIGGEGTEVIDCDYTGTDPIVMGLNATYLTQALNALGTDTVTLGHIPGKPAMLTPNGESTNKFVHIIMPVRLP